MAPRRRLRCRGAGTRCLARRMCARAACAACGASGEGSGCGGAADRRWRRGSRVGPRAGARLCGAGGGTRGGGVRVERGPVPGGSQEQGGSHPATRSLPRAAGRERRGRRPHRLGRCGRSLRADRRSRPRAGPRCRAGPHGPGGHEPAGARPGRAAPPGLLAAAREAGCSPEGVHALGGGGPIVVSIATWPGRPAPTRPRGDGQPDGRRRAADSCHPARCGRLEPQVRDGAPAGPGRRGSLTRTPAGHVPGPRAPRRSTSR